MENVRIGIDVGGTGVKFGMFTEDGELRDTWTMPTVTDSQEDLLERICACLAERCRETGIGRSQVKSIGIGVPGAVREDGFLYKCVNADLGDNYPAQEVGTHFPGARVVCANDANAAALGEAWKGSAAGAKSMAMLTLGTGVGCGIVVDGHMVAGAHGMGGELGHLFVEPDEREACSCGNRGCLEQYASATGIVRLMKRELERSDAPSLLRTRDRFESRDVCIAAEQGDAAAMAVVSRAMGYLARAVHVLIRTVDPQVILIGGGVSRAGDTLLRPLLHHVRQVRTLTGDYPEIRIAALGAEAGLYGAARAGFTAEEMKE
ncbi:MAG: ROK family protein [Lachnospiraceae bacterium]|nr:ROK family protein [Lachnospiraceae bacterium]